LGFPDCATRAKKTQTLGVLLGWAKLKKQKARVKKPSKHHHW